MKRKERERRAIETGLSASAPSYRLKLNRAHVHLDALDTAVERFIEEHCRAVIELDADAGDHVLRAYISAQPPPYLSVLAGDCVHDLRSALNHLAFDLAKAHRSSPLPKGAEEGLEFPVCTNPNSFASQRQGKIQWIAPAAQELIKSMQPYERPDWEPLAFVHDLNRVDKHRKLNLLVAAFGSASATVTPSKGFTISAPPGPIEDGAELLRWPAEPSNAGEQDESDGQATFEVVVGEGPFERWWLVTQLRVAETLIRDRVIPPLEPYL